MVRISGVMIINRSDAADGEPGCGPWCRNCVFQTVSFHCGRHGDAPWIIVCFASSPPSLSVLFCPVRCWPRICSSIRRRARIRRSRTATAPSVTLGLFSSQDFDPARQQQQASAPPPPAAAEPPQGGVVRGAARGAAVGAVGGAIAGNAGKGAAVGAATGGLLGGMRRSDQQQRQQYEAQQAQNEQSAAASQQRAAYDRALGACLTGRGYTVN